MPTNTTDREGLQAWMDSYEPSDKYEWQLEDIEATWQAAQAQSAERVRVLEALLLRSLEAYDIPNDSYLADKSYEDDVRGVLAKSALGEK